MSDEVSDNLALPYLQPSQAQKHVTHNEALERLDILVQLTVEAFGATTPPSLPAPGEVHALGVGTTGAWAGHDGELAAWMGAAWLFIEPRAGWRAWSLSDRELRLWDGAEWIGVVQNLPTLGINATADATNRLVLASQAALFNHDGADHRLTINKAGPGDTASVIFQSDFSGRAEMGLAGEDNYSFKVSPDGDSWIDAFTLDAQTGTATLLALQADSYGGAGVTQDTLDTAPGRLTKVGDFGLGSFAPPSIDDTDAMLASGFYRQTGGAGDRMPSGPGGTIVLGDFEDARSLIGIPRDGEGVFVKVFDFDGTVSQPWFQLIGRDPDTRRIIGDDELNFGFDGGNPTTLNVTGIRVRSVGLQASRHSAPPMFLNRGTSAGAAMLIRFDGDDVGSIAVDATSTSFNTSSDHRLKRDVAALDAETALAAVQAMPLRRFAFNAQPGVERWGFLAHELDAVFASAVSGEKDAVDADGRPEYQGVDHSKLVPALVGAIQALQARIKALEERDAG